MVLKKLFFGLFLVLLSSSAFATVFLHSPVEARLGNNDKIVLGKVAPGQAIVIVIEKKSEKPDKWDGLFVDSVLLPAGWEHSVKSSDEAISVEIRVPVNAKVSNQRINMTAFSSGEPGFGDVFFADVSVVSPENVFTAGIDLTQIEATVNESVELNLTISNNSVADAVFLVSSNLPLDWLAPRELVVNAQSTKTFSLPVNLLAYGKRTAALTVASAHGSFSETFGFEVNVFPLLSSKFQAPFFGVPFFSLTLWPYYLLNSVLSVLQ